MSKAISFIKLDFITVKPYLTLKSLLILAVAAMIMLFNSDSAPLVTGFVMVFGALYVSYPFAVGEKNGIDSLYATLSISRDTVVLGRYLFALVANIGSGALAYAVLFVLSVVLNKDFNAAETVLVILVMLAVYSSVQAFQLPMYFKLGYAKAKVLAYLPYVAWPLAVLSFASLLKNDKTMEFLLDLPLWINGHFIAFCAICALIWFAFMFISYRIALVCYKKRDF